MSYGYQTVEMQRFSKYHVKLFRFGYVIATCKDMPEAKVARRIHRRLLKGLKTNHEFDPREAFTGERVRESVAFEILHTLLDDGIAAVMADLDIVTEDHHERAVEILSECKITDDSVMAVTGKLSAELAIGMLQAYSYVEGFSRTA